MDGLTIISPIVVSRIIDNSVFFVTESSELTSFQVITSDRGKANEIVRLTTLSEAISKFGYPNSKKHGLAYYNVLNSLIEGADVLIMRVVPDLDIDQPEMLPASIANAFIDIQTKTLSALTEAEVDLLDTIIEDSSIDGEQKVSFRELSAVQFARIEAGSKISTPQQVYGASTISLGFFLFAEKIDQLLSIAGITAGGEVKLYELKEDGTTEALSATTFTVSDKANISTSSLLLLPAAPASVEAAVLSGTVLVKRVSGTEEINVGYVNVSKVAQVAAVDVEVEPLVIANLSNGTKVAFTVGGVNHELYVNSAVNGISLSDFFVDIPDATADIGPLASAIVGTIETIVSKSIEPVNGSGTYTIGVTTGGIFAEGDVVKPAFIVTVADTTDILEGAYTTDGTAEGYIFEVISGTSLRLSVEDGVLADGDLITDRAAHSSAVGVAGINKGSEASGIVESVETNDVLLNMGTSEVDFVSGEYVYKVGGDESDFTDILALTDFDLGYFNVISFADTLPFTVATLTLESKPERVDVRPVVLHKRATSNEEFESFMEAPYLDPDLPQTTLDGYKRHILFGFSDEHSSVSNRYGMSFSINNESDDNGYPFRLYNFSFTEEISGRTIIPEGFGPFVVSFDPDSMDLAEDSFFIYDILNKYTDKFELYKNIDNYYDLMNDLDLVSSDVNVNQLDILSSQERITDLRTVMEQVDVVINNGVGLLAKIGGTDAFANYTQEMLTYKTISMNGFTVLESYQSYGKVAMGSAGSLEGLDIDGVALTRVEVAGYKNYLKEKAYRGLINEQVFNKKKYPIDYLFDCNETKSIKEAMYDFVKSEFRQDCFLYLDMGINKNYLEAVSKRENDLSFANSYLASIFSQSLTVYDSYNKVDIKVTPCFFLAKMVIENEFNVGSHKPLAGKTRGVLSGHKADSLSFNPNKMQRDELYKKQVNYMVDDSHSTRFMGQLTSQKKNSALSNNHVITTLLKMKRKAELIAENYQFEDNDTVIRDLQADISFALSPWEKNGALESLTVVVYQSDYENKKKRARVRIECDFVDIVESIILDWIVNG